MIICMPKAFTYHQPYSAYSSCHFKYADQQCIGIYIKDYGEKYIQANIL
ncbi:MAG: hypothetical protein OXT67_01540 [Zetaproteobacteria bacterium]|nr:hypothetical protein [Zetaproteobacteria bacterium]